MGRVEWSGEDMSNALNGAVGMGGGEEDGDADAEGREVVVVGEEGNMEDDDERETVEADVVVGAVSVKETEIDEETLLDDSETEGVVEKDKVEGAVDPPYDHPSPSGMDGP